MKNSTRKNQLEKYQEVKNFNLVARTSVKYWLLGVTIGNKG